MAETGITLHTGAAGAGAGAGTSAPKSSTSRAPEAKSIVDYIGLTARASKLHQDGETFVANVVSEAAKYKIEFAVEKIMGDNYEARVLRNGGNCVIMIFHETFVRRDMSHIPSVSVTKDCIRKLELTGITDKVIQCIVVLKDQYEKYENVAAGIINSFRAVDGTFKDVSIQDYNASGELHVSMNLKEVLQYAETTTGSPMPHADSGLMVYSKRRDPNKSSYGTDDMILEPIGAVLGYTDLKRVPDDMFGANYKINPTFVITGVFSPIRTREMAMFLISVGADAFIMRNMWLTAFSSFSEGEKNLGNLFINPQTKKPYACKNIQERQMLIQQKFTSNIPFLAIDLQEGADQFPGLKDLLADPDGVKAALKDFSGGENALMHEIVQGAAIQYDGVVDTAKGKVDTRAVDFLFLVDPKGAGVSHDRAACFLDYPDPNDPRAIEKKASMLEEFYNSSKIELAYTTHRLFFNPDFIVGLATDLSSSINLIFDSYVNNQVYDTSNLKRFANNTAAAFSAGGGMGGWTGFRGFAY